MSEISPATINLQHVVAAVYVNPYSSRIIERSEIKPFIEQQAISGKKCVNIVLHFSRDSAESMNNAFQKALRTN